MSPLIVDKKLKRQELVQAAFAVFAHKGYQGASMREIAVQAGMGKGTIYEYFTDKEDLFYACFDHYNQVCLDQVALVLKDCTGGMQRLLALMRFWLEMAGAYMDIYALSLEVWSLARNGAAHERFNTKLRETYQNYRATLEAILREGQACGDFRQDMDVPGIAALLTGAVDGAMLQLWFERSLDITGYLNNFLEVLIRGMRPDAKE